MRLSLRSSLLDQQLPTIIILALLGAGFYPHWLDLTGLWATSLVWTHGWLIGAVCLFTLFTGPAPPTAAPRLVRLTPFAALLPVYLFLHFAYIDLAQELLLPLFGIALAYWMGGPAGMRRYAFPFAYLYFAIPVWDVLVPTLQHVTVAANRLLLAAMSVPVQVRGDLISVPVGVFNVEGGCSGSHFLVVALAVSALHGRLWELSWRRRIAAVLLAGTLALIANWIRVFTVIVRAIQTDMQTPLIKDHYWFGWCLFAGALGIYFLVMRYFDPGAAPTTAQSPPGQSPGLRRLVWATLPVILLLGATFARVETYHLAWGEVNTHIRVAPTFAGRWHGPLLTDAPWHPLFPGADREVIATYQNETGPVVWYRASYAEQHAGSKLVGYGNTLTPEDWSILSQEASLKSKNTAYTLPQLPVLLTSAESGGGDRWRIWSWYVVNGHKVALGWQARMWMGLQGFTLNKPALAGIVAIAAPCEPDCRTADAQLSLFKEKLGDHQ